MADPDLTAIHLEELKADAPDPYWQKRLGTISDRIAELERENAALKQDSGYWLGLMRCQTLRDVHEAMIRLGKRAAVAEERVTELTGRLTLTRDDRDALAAQVAELRAALGLSEDRRRLAEWILLGVLDDCGEFGAPEVDWMKENAERVRREQEQA